MSSFAGTPSPPDHLELIVHASAPLLTVEHFGSAGLYEHRDALLDVYRHVYAAELADPFFSVDRFWDRLTAYAARDGFGLSTGTLDGTLIGYALGYTLPAGSGWWRGLLAPVDPDLLIETGSRTFAVNEIMVLEAFRRHGYARALHDSLVDARPEPRATLLVEPDNIPARTAYLSWGWRKIGDLKPFDDSPIYEAMLLDLPRR